MNLKLCLEGCMDRTHKHTHKSLSCVRLFATPWIVVHQAPWSMGFSRHEYWSGLPFPSPIDRTEEIKCVENRAEEILYKKLT